MLQGGIMKTMSHADKNISVFGALKSCVIPFIIPDLLKMSFAVLVSERLKKSIKNKTVQI